MKKTTILRNVLTISVILVLLLTSCGKEPEPTAGEALEEENTLLETENSIKSVEMESGIEEKEKAEREAAERAEAEAERIAEEESINLIIEENQEMIKDFLMNFSAELEAVTNYGVQSGQIWVRISLFDFNNDGKNEIMLSKEYVAITKSGAISYNYVYDWEGNELFEFLGGSVLGMTICADRERMEFFFCSNIYWAGQNNTSLYTKVVKHENWEKEVNIGVWDTRKAGQMNPEDSYCIFRVSAEAEQGIFAASYGEMTQIARAEEWRVSEEAFEEYLQSYEELEEHEIEWHSGILYSQGEFIMNPNEEDEIILWAEE